MYIDLFGLKPVKPEQTKILNLSLIVLKINKKLLF